MTHNPYSAPDTAEPAKESRLLSSMVAGLGLLGSLGLLTLYSLIAAISAYEWVSMSPSIRATDYIRTFIASLVFGLLSCAAATQCYSRQRHGLLLLMFSSVLAGVFVFPGLNTVWNIVEGIFF